MIEPIDIYLDTEMARAIIEAARRRGFTVEIDEDGRLKLSRKDDEPKPPPA